MLSILTLLPVVETCSGVRQRRLAKPSLNSGSLSTVSARALMCGTFGFSFIQNGIRPQRAITTSRSSSRGSMRTHWDLVGWRDVVAEWEVRLRESLGFEQPAIGITSDEIIVPAAHYRSGMWI